MKTFEAIYGRRSIREFARNEQIPESNFERIIRAAGHCPSDPIGQYPWRLILIRDDQGTKDLLADCAKEVAQMVFGTSYEAFGPGHLWYISEDHRLAVAETRITGELWEYPRDADAVFVPVVSKGAWTDTLASYTGKGEYVAQHLGFAVQNMWLTGHSYGVGAGYSGMPSLDVRRREQIAEFLGIPPSWEMTGAFCFGFPSRPRHFGPSRPPIDSVTFSEYWGNCYVREALSEEMPRGMELPVTELEDAIENLNFVEGFEDADVPQWMVEKVVDAAMWGPVPENSKNWRFIIVRDKDAKRFLSEIVNEKKHEPGFFNSPEHLYGRLQYLPESDRVERMEEFFEADLGGWLAQADVLIVVVNNDMAWGDSPGMGIPGPPPLLAISAGCCIQNSLIAASALGLGINYDVLAGGAAKTRQLVLDYFGVPASSWYPQGIIGLGKPGKKLRAPPRPSLESLVYSECWGNSYKFKTL
jgi:nitroreductase